MLEQWRLLYRMECYFITYTKYRKLIYKKIKELSKNTENIRKDIGKKQKITAQRVAVLFLFF